MKVDIKRYKDPQQLLSSVNHILGCLDLCQLMIGKDMTEEQRKRFDSCKMTFEKTAMEITKQLEKEQVK